jgi:hypothetical protein
MEAADTLTLIFQVLQILQSEEALPSTHEQVLAPFHILHVVIDRRLIQFVCRCLQRYSDLFQTALHKQSAFLYKYDVVR